ncbi:RTA1-domain-containing protein [Dichomitus squalens]|uniref:RTA1-domain-containing protein n=1 Tax=Dichomitus squalens TaxID=114155 RepID=A0A4Q9MUB3_9APHY|nr:RTA1-domain-containing protein [Dichomitus squalens]
MSTRTSSITAASAATTVDSVHSINNPYGYVPTKWICILFIVLFSVSTIIHLVQAIRSRLWWLLITACLAGIGEILGWSARLWSNQNVSNIEPYIMQITTTIIAPTPLIAANFVILGQIIGRMGQRYSRITAKWYTIIFCAFDIVALVVQAVGGAGAAGAVQKGKNPTPGGHIMLAGVSFQMVSLVFYVLLASEFILRYAYDHPFARYGQSSVARRKTDPETKQMVFGLALEAVFLFIRSIYRVVELSEGWNGKVIKTQWYFNVFDAAMIVLAMYTLNFFHPGRLLSKADAWASKESEQQTEENAMKGFPQDSA